jgi:hypothetical protein
MTRPRKPNKDATAQMNKKTAVGLLGPFFFQEEKKQVNADAELPDDAAGGLIICDKVNSRNKPHKENRT